MVRRQDLKVVHTNMNPSESVVRVAIPDRVRERRAHLAYIKLEDTWSSIELAKKSGAPEASITRAENLLSEATAMWRTAVKAAQTCNTRIILAKLAQIRGVLG